MPKVNTSSQVKSYAHVVAVGFTANRPGPCLTKAGRSPSPKTLSPGYQTAAKHPGAELGSPDNSIGPVEYEPVMPLARN